MDIPLTVHGIEKNTCSLSEKECEGVWVTFGDGTFNNVFLGWRAFGKMLKMKSCGGKQAASATSAAKANGKPAEVKS